MRLYQDERIMLKNTSANDNIADKNDVINHYVTQENNGVTIYNDSNIDDNNNGGVASNGVKLRKRSKHLSPPISNRHSWSDFRPQQDDVILRSHDRQQRKNSFNVSKRSWTGSEFKLSDIKEVRFEDSGHNLVYSRRNAISSTNLNQISSEKKPDKGWMGGIRRKISVTVSIIK